jgi:exodeoxyribonuclease VII small subunit
MEPKNFREAYGVLQQHAQTLRDQREPNIDDLLAIVTESVAAYKVCKARIHAVEKALQDAFTDVDVDTATADERPRDAKAAPAPAAPATDADDELDDNDIPF